MKTNLIIPFFLLLLGGISIQAQGQIPPQDSTADIDSVRKPMATAVQPVVAPATLVKEDAVIAAASQSPTVTKQKVAYISEVTKYGFRNLFSNYNYNPNISYNVQVNPNAEQFIQDYVKTHGAYLQKMKDWGMPYFNFIESILTQYGLPRELKYIAVIESNLQNSAISSKGACGPWQLMPGTAQQLGLTINKYVDERTDYYKSTNAAAKYLLALYSQLNDWLLVMAAYNGGMGRVQYAITKSNSRDFWKLQYYLPEESRDYVKRFIATHFIMEGTGGVTTASSAALNDSIYDKTYNVGVVKYSLAKGINPYNTASALTDSEKTNLKETTISGKYSGAIIAKHLAMPMADFKHYNPAFDDMLATTGSYDLRLPADKMDIFLTDKYVILNESVTALLGSLSMPTGITTYPKKHYYKPTYKKKWKKHY